ncbi:MAG: fibronectin type III domain-containing protein [Alloprevotella sp.]|nr:fibronectin type III domain-containing protein [Alloprevotella sp.]
MGTPAFSRSIKTLALLALLALAGQAQAQTTIYANMIYHDDWKSGSEEYGFYAINAADGTYEAVSPTDTYFYNGNCGAVVTSDGTVHLVNRDTQYGITYLTYYEYDFQTWKPTAAVGEYGIDLDDYTLVATDLAEDPVTGKVYGCFSNAANTAYNLGVVDFNTRTRSTIANYGVTPVLALAFDRFGTLYGVKKDGYLYRINTSDGEQTEVGDLGFNLAALPQSMTCDLSTGKLYLAAVMQDYSTALYEINPVTVEATLVCEFPKGEEFTGLYIPAPAISGNAPAAVEGLTADFPKGALSGTVGFTLPVKSVGGQALSGSLNYTLRVNGDARVETRMGTPGEKVSLQLSVPAGFVTVSVTTANTYGEGERAQQTFWAGHDTPLAPTDVQLSVSDEGKATLTWQAPAAEGVNGGYVATEALTYRIVRYPEETVVSEAHSGTTFTETLPETGYTEYSYSVTAAANGLESEAVRSNAVKHGNALPVPFNATFDTQEEFNAFTVYSLNDDSFRWIWYEKEDDGGVAVCPNTDKVADDWLFTPPILLEGGKDYTFSVDYRAYSSTYPERMEIFWGPNNAPADAALQSLLPPTDVTAKAYYTFQTVVRPETDGAYYFAIHDISGANAMYLQIDNLSVTEGASAVEMNNAVTTADFSECVTTLGTAVEATVTITNAGKERVENVTYVVSSEDEGQQEEVTIDVPGAPTFGNSVTLRIPLPAASKPCRSTRYVTFTKVNGIENDTKTNGRTAKGSLLTLKENTPRRSVVEEFTGAWCQNCTRGIAGLARMERDYEDFIGIAVHGDDPMEISAYRPIINLDIVPGYPFALIDRTVGTDPFFGNGDYSTGDILGFGLDRVWEAQRQTLSEGGVSLHEPVIEGDVVNITTDVTFQFDAAEAPYSLAYVLLCDSVCRPADKTTNQDIAEWAQVNNLTGNGNYATDPDLGPWTTSPYRIIDMAYNHVAVAASDVVDGVEGSVQMPIVCGTPQTHTYSFNLREIPYAQHRDKLRVVAMLINTRTGRIVNADERHVSDPTGISPSLVTRHPATIYDLQGRIISNGGRPGGIVIQRSADGTTRKLLSR